MTSHELARMLLDFPDLEVSISVDISTCEEDSTRRVFADPEELQLTSDHEVTILSVGSTND